MLKAGHLLLRIHYEYSEVAATVSERIGNVVKNLIKHWDANDTEILRRACISDIQLMQRWLTVTKIRPGFDLDTRR